MSAAITLNFRRPELTHACVESLLADGWAPVLVWDNSQDDGESMRVMETSLGGRPDVILVGSPANIGFAAGMNNGLTCLRDLGLAGPTLLVNNDAIVRVGLRACLEARLAPGTRPALVAPRIAQAGTVKGWMHYQPWFGLVSERPGPGTFPYLSGCCLALDTRRWAGPLFDESFFMYGEDVELSRRFAECGGDLVLLDEAFVTHLGSASSGQATAFYERHVVRAHWLLAEKLASGRASGLAMRALRLPVLGARACVRVLRHHSMEPLRALWAIIGGGFSRVRHVRKPRSPGESA